MALRLMEIRDNRPHDMEAIAGGNDDLSRSSQRLQLLRLQVSQDGLQRLGRRNRFGA